MIDRKQERIKRFQRKKKQKTLIKTKPRKVNKNYYEDYE